MSIIIGQKVIASNNVSSIAWGAIVGNLLDQEDLKNVIVAKAPLDSPVLTGVPTAPTPLRGANNNQIATTAFVNDAVSGMSTEDCVHITGNETINGTKTFNDAINLNNTLRSYNSENKFATYTHYSIEFKPLSTQTHGGHIDFHYKGKDSIDGVDYTSRIIEESEGALKINDSLFYSTQPSVISVQPTDDTTSSRQIDTVGARNTKLANYVTTNTNQTVSGVKTFSSDISFANASYDGPSGFLYQQNAGQLAIGLRDETDSSWSQNWIQFAQKGITQIRATTSVMLNGGAPATVNMQPTEDSEESLQLDTVGARNAKLANYVDKSSAEEIGGNKTFTGTATFSKSNDTRIIAKASDVTRGSAPASNSYSGVTFRDKNNSELAAIYSRYSTAGEVASILYVKSPVSDSTANIQIGVRADGTFYTSAPTPVSASNNTNIATTAWVNTKLSSYGAPNWSSKTKITSGYTAASNGFVTCCIYIGDNGAFEVFVNGSSITYMQNEHLGSHGYCFPVKKGDVVTWSGSPNNNYCYFVPLS